MHVYVDESGNTAPLGRPSATRHFALVALVIHDRERVERAIRQLRHQLHFEKEFKSHKTPIAFRIALLEVAVSLGLSFDVMVVDKELLSPEWQSRNGLALYEAVAKKLLTTVTRSFKKAILIIDQVDAHQTAVLKKGIRAAVNPSRPNKENPKRIKKVSGHNSRQSDLLQLAPASVSRCGSWFGLSCQRAGRFPLLVRDRVENAMAQVWWGRKESRDR